MFRADLACDLCAGDHPNWKFLQVECFQEQKMKLLQRSLPARGLRVVLEGALSVCNACGV